MAGTDRSLAGPDSYGSYRKPRPRRRAVAGGERVGETPRKPVSAVEEAEGGADSWMRPMPIGFGNLVDLDRTVALPVGAAWKGHVMLKCGLAYAR